MMFVLSFKKLTLFSLVAEAIFNVNANPVSDDANTNSTEIAKNGSAIAPLVINGNPAASGAYPYYGKWQNNGAIRSDDHRLFIVTARVCDV